MFEAIQDKTISLMLKLAGEHYGNISKDIFSGIDLIKFFNLCKEHELEGVIASHLIDNPEINLPEIWIQAYQDEKERLTDLKKEMYQICSEMRKNNIPIIILKNGGIMADIISDPAACPMGDIDSLVARKDFRNAHNVLLNLGYSFKFRSEFEKEDLENAIIDGSTEYYKSVHDSKVWFELSWRAIAGRWIRLDKEPGTDMLFQDYIIAKDSDVGVLSPENNLLQVCIHTAKHSYVRAPGLRLHLDVERIVTHKKIDWSVFLQKVESVHVKTSSYYSLLIPQHLFGTEIPQHVLDSLSPSAGKKRLINFFLSRAGLLHPHEKKFSKLGFVIFQFLLYDSFYDAWKVLYPSWEWYADKFHSRNRILLPYFMMLRLFDLVGIRKKK